MQSNNPVFRRSEEFQRAGHATNGRTDPSSWAISRPGQRGPGQAGPTDPYAQGHGQGQGYDQGQGYGTQPAGSPMTIDTVVQKTAMSIGTVVVAALATWILLPEVTPSTAETALPAVGAAATIGLLGAFALSMVNSFKRVISPALVIAFAVLEGVGLGAISMLFNAAYPGAVQGAVIGTFAAFAGTLTAYKVLNIKVGDKFCRGVVAAMFGMVGLSLMELVLGLFGAQIGLFGVSGLGMLTAVAGLVLGVFMLILDFDFVEQGIANRLPEVESWRAAFAMTVSLVWIYTNLLRIMAFFSSD